MQEVVENLRVISILASLSCSWRYSVEYLCKLPCTAPRVSSVFEFAHNSLALHRIYYRPSD